MDNTSEQMNDSDEMNDEEEEEEEEMNEENIFIGHVFLTSQSEVDTFAQEQYTKIVNGSLSIENDDINDPITSLSNLHTLTSVDLTLKLLNLSQLQSLSGLENIEFVGGLLRIVNLPNLNNISDLPQNDSIKHYILETLPNVTSVPHFMEHTSIDTFTIFNLTAINELNIFPNLIRINNFADIRQNENLNSLNGFQNLTSIENLFTIEFNHNLEVINPWSSYEGDRFGSLKIIDNALTDVNFLQNMVSIGNLQIEGGNDDHITELSGLSNLNSIGGTLKIENLMINDLNDLNSISNIAQMFISKCNLIENLDGLNNLLTNDFGANTTINIQLNDNLRDFCGISDYIANNTINSFDISGNLFNPTEDDFTNGNCAN